MFFDKL